MAGLFPVSPSHPPRCACPAPGPGLTCAKCASSFHTRAQRRTVSTACEQNALEEAIASAKKNLPAGHRRSLLNNRDSRSSPSPPGAAGLPAAAAAGPVSGESGFGPACWHSGLFSRRCRRKLPRGGNATLGSICSILEHRAGRRQSVKLKLIYRSQDEAPNWR